MRRTIGSSLLFSSLLFTASAFASPPAGNSVASTPRVSTGVTAPRLLNSLELNAPDSFSATTVPAGTQISVTFVVDENGQPRNIHVTRGYDPLWNARVIDAVSKLHYVPASMDNQAIPLSMNLVVTLAR